VSPCALARTRSLRPSWAVGTQACRFSEFFKIFKHRHFDIQIGDLPYVQISLNFAGRQIVTQREISLFVSSSKSQMIANYRFWDTFKFESFMNFKGIQTFLKKSDKFYKIPYPHPILDYKFALTHLYSNIGSFFTSGNMYCVFYTK
jgi:hypothetical protein